MASGAIKDTSALLKAAEKNLADAWGGTVRLGSAERLTEKGHRNLLLRCKVLRAPSGSPASVMLKRAAPRRYKPDDAKNRTAVGLFRDWAGLQFLSGRGREISGAPKFYAGNREHGFFLMEDLGPAIDVDLALQCGTPQWGAMALVALAKTLGRMHATTLGTSREQEYLTIRGKLGPGDGRQRERLGRRWRRSAPLIAEMIGAMEVEVPARFFDDVRTIASAMDEPGPFLAYTHGDPCPDNSRLIGGRLCLIDFEFAGFRHALVDGVYGCMRFPTCWNVRDIPQNVLNDMEKTYRQELIAGGCAAAADDGEFYRAVANACGSWAMRIVYRALERALQYEAPQGLATDRDRLLTRVDAFVRAAERSKHLEAMRVAFAGLYEKLRAIWSNQMPLYDAFTHPCGAALGEIRKLFKAIRENRAGDVVQMLEKNPALAHSKDPDDRDQSPVLFPAIESKNPAIVRALLEKGADWRLPSRAGWNVLVQACGVATPEIVDLLIQHGAQLNERDRWGSLPIYAAMGNQEMLNHLLQRGAKVDLKVALDVNRLDLAEKLIKDFPAWVHFRFGTGLTLLHDLARGESENIAAMKLLLDNGADVNAVTNWDATPLHVAAFNGRARTAEILLRHGAKPNEEDNRGRTPLAIAASEGHQRTAEVIRTHGGTEKSTQSGPSSLS